jgi:hypothetical protein
MTLLLDAELRRQATAAGVFLVDELVGWREYYEPLTPDEVEQLLVWLDRWQGARREWLTERPERLAVQRDAWLEQYRDLRVLPMLSREDPPAGFELIRRSWCPRCERDGDPLGPGSWVTYTGAFSWTRKRRRFRCEVVPPAPEREIGQLCGRQVPAPPEDCGHYTITGVDGLTLTLDSGDDTPVEQAYTNTITSTGSFIGDGYRIGEGITITETRPCRCRRLYRWGLRRKTRVDQAIDGALHEIDQLYRGAEHGISSVQGRETFFATVTLEGDELRGLRDISWTSRTSRGAVSHDVTASLWRAGAAELRRLWGSRDADLTVQFVYPGDDQINTLVLEQARIVELTEADVTLDCMRISQVIDGDRFALA